ncbi:cadherin-23 [Aricia agestis]|uniref:cadherin-23 n=1 Tax=Aricia agestis TaxID=91739 RepID=UPI001C2066F4|nr:cadherin-23 [Aricia agestis]XP_041976288.1 cadherin-23 [Aricia agestis]XP_041976289.1 cadherin-23 [Aricia agestis]
MAEIIFQRRIATAIPTDPLIILLLMGLLQQCGGQFINRAPHFVPQTGDMSQFVLPEDTKVGTPVYQLKGIDPENGQLTYSISGQYFTVDSLTGVVTLAKALDREEQATLEVIISLTDEPTEDTEPNTISLRRVIPVRDVNDNAPIFHNRPYIVNISEATPVGSEIEVNPNIVVTDRDEGVNAKVEVVCSNRERGGDAEACATFRLVTEQVTPNEYRVRIFLSKPLDYESRTAFVISIEAVDGGTPPLRASASVAVAVRDEQDQPPVFLTAPYSAAVVENTPPNTSIMEISAVDGDTENPRSVLLTLEGDSAKYFRLAPDRPLGSATLLTTDVPIDRESDIVVQNGGVYSFYVKATELINNELPSDFTVMPVTIIVTDDNDHIPEFNKKDFDISIPENIENGSPIPGLSVYVDDNDIGQNSRYNLSLRDVHNSEGVFYISTDHGEGRTPINIKVKDTTKLDYDVDDEDKRHFSFDMIASVNGEELSSARVNIKLLDVNDNAPVFEQPNYKFYVLESEPVGFKIADVSATDKDYGIYGDIEYTLMGFGSNLFKVDRNKGGLYVGRTLDYESQTSYSLTLIAKDGGGKSATTSIFIDVLDANDNAPVFDSPEYTRTIRDGATSFEPQLVVRATDIDGPAQGGGRIRYTLQSDNSIAHPGQVFAVHPEQGEITVLRPAQSMDTPRGLYELVIRATDFGNPPLFNETRVLVRVGVPGNQRPTFKGNYHHLTYTLAPRGPATTNSDYALELGPVNYKASVREDAQPGQHVQTVQATDPDGLDNLLRYHIVNGAKDNFVIDEVTGEITVSNDAHLDRDNNPDRYEITVSAVDSGTPIPETATTTVFVNVLDVNDKPPKFNITDTTTYISEKTKIDSVVTKMTAEDTDLNAQLKFSIIEPIKAFSKAGVLLKPSSPFDYRNMFKINEDSGEIIVNGSLDYSQMSSIILTIKVTDINAETNKEQQFDTKEYTIYIQPYADKNPQFTNPGWTTLHPVIYHQINEEQPIGSTVLVLMAEDPVSGHVVTNFKVINSETGLLQVDPLSGQVVLTKHLDYEELTSPNLTMTVHATSNDGTKHSTAKVVIEVLNINDHAPIFENELFKVSVLESIQYPERILTVQAKDADAVLSDLDKKIGYADVRYALRGDNAELFVIDNVTGVIQVAPNKTLDRERQSVLRLEVEAYDTPNGGADRLKATTTVLVDVLDVNDNDPKFDKDLYIAVVPENAQIGMSILKMTAMDPDEGLGGEIKYELVDEGDANGLFTLDATTGEVRVRSLLTGRGRTGAYRLLGAAADGGGRTAHAQLALYIGDLSANDGVPRVLRPEMKEILSVPENATLGSMVYQVVASDPDDPATPAGQLTYSIQRTNADADVFDIDSQTGVLTLRRPLDRETRATYTVVLVVEDRGSPPQRTARVLTVSVADVDDHAPHFARSLDDPPILIATKEEVPVGTIIGELQAVDEDIDENAAIDYMITAGNNFGLLKLERTNASKALIIAAARLDREEVSKLVITVKCFKLGTTPRYSKSYNRLDLTEIQVVIKVLDIDDHLPEFESANMTVGVRLNVPVDSIIARVKAVDRDADAKPIRYEIVNISFESPIKSRSVENVTDVIGVNNVTGDLKIMKNLIHYADGLFRLTVRANNSNETDRFSDIRVEVVVVRERDLLRLVGVGGRALAGLRERVAAALRPMQLRLQLHDTAHASGPCFQIRKDSGEALSPSAARAALRTATGASAALGAAGAHVAACSTPRGAHSVAARALLALAGVLPLAALIAALALCCMHSAAKRRMRAALVPRETPRLYAEPLYST